MLEYCLRGIHVVVAVICHCVPQLFRDGLIPVKVKFLVLQAKLDLPLLQTLLLRGEVVDICVRDVVRLREIRVRALADDPLRDHVEFLVAVPQRSRVDNMIVIATVVEANQLGTQQSLDLFSSGVDKTHLVLIATLLVTDHEEVLEHLDVEEIDVSVSDRSHRFFRVVLELHLLDQLQAVLSVVCRSHRECNDGIPRIRDVVHQTTCGSIIENLLDELHRRLGPGMDLLAEVPSNKVSKTLLCLDYVFANHLRSLPREIIRRSSDRNSVRNQVLTPKGGLPGKSLDFDSRSILLSVLEFGVSQ